jgi:TolB-like protein/Flp pilus assembly protein TadD
VEKSRPAGHRVIQFGEFEVDLRAGELRKHGAKVRLQEQPLQVLQILLDNPGEVITRDELRRRIWAANTFVDFDHGLNNAIKRLREALGDTAESPRYIETLPRKGYRCIAAVSESPLKIESLAVLPLENLSRDPEQEYFAEGLTEAIITSLAKIGALRVVSRTSAMQYKGAHKSVREIAQELQVDGVIEGTVQRSGERVRISAQLIHASTDSHLWAESYDRDLRDVLALQAELAQAIAREIRVKLTPIDQARLTEARPVIPEAYTAYLKGRYHWNRRSGEGLGKATENFQQAIAKDPTFAAAYSGLADCMVLLGLWGMTAPDAGCGKAKALALQALEMDRGCAEAYTSLAFATTWYDYDFLTAEREFERSLELNPRYVLAHTWFGFFLALMGRNEEAYTELTRATRLDPCSSTVYLCWGMLHWAARRYDPAIQHYERAIELEPSNALAHAFKGVAYQCKALYDPAVAALQESIQLSPGASSLVASLGETYARAGMIDAAQRILRQLQDLAKQRYVTPHIMARLNIALGKGDEALSCLETSYRGRDPLMVMMKVDPRLDDLRSEPRFQELLRRMNFPS